MNFNWDVFWQYLLQPSGVYLTGLWLTCLIAVSAMLLGCVLGLAAALLSLSKNPLLHLPVRFYVWLLRGTPLLVQIVFLYTALAAGGIFRFEDIDLFGISFNTSLGDWALSGEYAYRPNQPLQVLQSDVLFALLGPALPAQDILIGAGTVTDPALLGQLPAALAGPLQELATAVQRLELLPPRLMLATAMLMPGSPSAAPSLYSARRPVTQSTPLMTQELKPLPPASRTLTAQRRAPGATPTRPMLLSLAAAVPATWVPWPWPSLKVLLVHVRPLSRPTPPALLSSG
jgi:His/Glu/Gln/Arg/opine family amino acid ABC transporter permease subunit